MLSTITIFDKTVGTYALCAFAGLMCCGFCAARLGKRHKIGIDDTILTLLVAAFGLFVGGHVLYTLTRLPDLVMLISRVDEYTSREWMDAVFLCFGGMVFYGGVLGAGFFVWVYTKRTAPGTLSAVMDVFAVTVPLFHTFGRIGCFLGGCCYGIESRFGFLVTDNVISPKINGVTRFPVQLLEAVCNLGIFLFMLWLSKKEKSSGKLFFIYLISYPPMRFLLEFLRGDEIRGIWFGLSTSQWISLVLLVWGALALSKKQTVK